ncbi:MAG: imelysin family protein [Cytophagaceae bacterium]
MKKIILLLTLLNVTVLVSCKKEAKEEVVEADRGPLLVHLSEKVILPRLDSLSDALNELSTAYAIFSSSKTTANLNSVRASYIQAVKAWEGVASLNFGPQNVYSLNTGAVNLFPIDTALILNNIKLNNTNFTTSTAPNYSGFPALDYLFYGTNYDDQRVVDSFLVQTNRTSFTLALINDLKQRVQQAKQSWSPSGSNFLNLFQNSKGLDIGSSFSAYVNMLVYDLEVVKNYKVGIPVGIINNELTNPQVVYPLKAEGCFSDSTISFIQQSITSDYQLYLGAAITDSLGMDSYLRSIQQVDLANRINNQWLVVINLSNQLNPSMEYSLNNSTELAKLTQLHAELVNLVALIKVDGASALGITIYYADNDGD